jgi:hypothetical protein
LIPAIHSRHVRRALCLALAALPAGASVAADTPAERAIESIRAEALTSPTGPQGWRLPLAASWNTGERATGYGPAYEVSEIEAGQYLLPWFGLSIPRLPSDTGLSNYPATTDAPFYYESAVRYLAAHHLPLSFESTQWERLLPEVSSQYPQPGADGHPPPLSPFKPVEPWYSVGRAWAQHETLRRIEKLYPDPPLVLFISNNEHPRLTPKELQAEYSANAGPELMARRRAIGDAWIERYRAMERGFREGLDASAWRAHAVFVGYEAFAGPPMGRWSGWTSYSLYVPGRTEPWAYAWDGASISYYLHDWAPDTDFTVWSPQIEAMNLVAELAQVRRTEPDFWFEMSVWDGQVPGGTTDKQRWYSLHHQDFTPQRYGGMVQFGMWLLRPRVVREFRGVEDDRIYFGKYFDAILAAVARVHDDATLRAFWRRGRLVVNPVGGHPYEEALPFELASRARWFLLDSPANPPRPWQLTTVVKVYALALVRGSKPHREWLIYAYSPLDTTSDVELTIPDGPRVRVPAGVGGAFSVVSESTAAVQRLAAP